MRNCAPIRRGRIHTPQRRAEFSPHDCCRVTRDGWALAQGPGKQHTRREGRPAFLTRRIVHSRARVVYRVVRLFDAREQLVSLASCVSRQNVFMIALPTIVGRDHITPRQFLNYFEETFDLLTWSDIFGRPAN